MLLGPVWSFLSLCLATRSDCCRMVCSVKASVREKPRHLVTGKTNYTRQVLSKGDGENRRQQLRAAAGKKHNVGMASGARLPSQHLEG